MSSDSVSFMTLSPDFIYILKIGDFDHVLRPADQKASNNLTLAKMAVGNVDTARNLLTERGPFLLTERHQKMDELIGDTEEAINRVIRLLTPARVEQVSGDSVRINTKNPWILDANEPKSAATFGRLQITNDKLKTVLHDLNNIEATAQLGDCEMRASTSVIATTSDQQLQPLSDSPDRDRVDLEPQDGKQLLAWRRSQRGHKHSTTSDGSSVSRFALEDRDLADVRTPVSSQSNSLLSTNNAVPSHLRANTPDSTANPGTSRTRADQPQVHTKRLFVIHELEAIPVEPSATINNDHNAIAMATNDAEMNLTGRNVQAKQIANGNAPQNDLASPQSKSKPTDKPGLQAKLSSKSSGKKLKRESFAEYRKRNRDSRVIEANMSAPVSPSNVRPKQQKDKQLEDRNDLRAHDSGAESQDSWIHLAKVETAQVVKYGKAGRPNQTLETRSASDSKVLQLPPAHPQRQLSDPVQTTLPSLSIGQSEIMSSTRMHLSQQTQKPNSATPQSRMNTQAQVPTTTKTHEVFLIDPVLTRLPSLLRPGQKGRSKVPAPYPVSDAGTDDEDGVEPSEFPQMSRRNQTTDRSMTAPPSQSRVQTALNPLRTTNGPEDNHQRSMSAPIVPQINVVRAPTIPRKPLPYRNSTGGATPGLTLGTLTEAEAPHRPDSRVSQVSQRANSPQRGHSGPPSPLESTGNAKLGPRGSAMSLQSLSVQAPSSVDSSRRSSISANHVEQVVSNASNVSLKPAALMNEVGAEGNIPRSQTELPLMEEATSNGRSSGPLAGDRTGVAETQSQVHDFAQSISPGRNDFRPRLPIQNPLTMHPPTLPLTQPSAYQAQSMGRAPPQPRPQQPYVQTPDPAWNHTQIDYNSPAFQQARHYLPSQPHMQPSRMQDSRLQSQSRFRDSDQVRWYPSGPVRTQTYPVLPPVDQAQAQFQDRARRASDQSQQVGNMQNAGFRPPVMLPPPRQQAQPPNVAKPAAAQIPIPTRAQAGGPAAIVAQQKQDREMFAASRWGATGNQKPQQRRPPLPQHQEINSPADPARAPPQTPPGHQPVVPQAGPSSQIPTRQTTQIQVDTSHQQQQANNQPQQRHVLPSQQRWQQEHARKLSQEAQPIARQKPVSPQQNSQRPPLPHQHSCHCDDEHEEAAGPSTSPHIRQQPPNSPSSIQRSPERVIRLTPLHEDRPQQHFSSTYKSVDIATEADGLNHVQTTMEPIPVATKTRRRSNWLSHQASRLKRDNSNGG